MADYERVGLFKGNLPANRWLAWLDREMRRVGGQSTPEDFFEAVEILFEDEAATWLDTSARYRSMIDNREAATSEDVEEFRTALRCEFPAKTPSLLNERNLQQDIGNFEQNLGETLSSYYGRAKELLRQSHGRDIPTDGKSPLAAIEVVVLNNVVTAFLGGIMDDRVREPAQGI
ncbi:hypothetical protein Golomagni_05547 [Golovinomyces magnicellulatus]|nr:hypothetical protein Golomagni_05547 [Golovinomyces magnicellulatus]